MPVNQSQRPKFYRNQYLGAEDLTAAVEYTRIQDGRHSLGAHTWGIALGLQLKEKELPGGQVDVYIQPGYGWDGFGRPIVVLELHKISAEKFKSFVYDAGIDGGSPEGRLIEVWLRYDEMATQMPRRGFEVCDPEDQFSRIQETFLIEVGRKSSHADRHDSISVAGRSVDAEQALKVVLDPTDPLIEDESIPYQTVPESGERRRWLIPLGLVRWKPNPNAAQPGNFVKRIAEDLEQSRRLRRYIGVVAEAVQAAAGHVRLKSRTQAPSLVWSDDLVWVEGSLRVEGDARLFGGKLAFCHTNGQDFTVPLQMKRVGDPGLGARALQVGIGPDSQTNNRFAVGPLKTNGEVDEKLVVLSGGNVGLGTMAPDHKLEIHGVDNSLVILSTAPTGKDRNAGLELRTTAGDGVSYIDFTKGSTSTLGSGTPDFSGRLSFNEANTGAFAISGANVGIGTLTPTTKLEVAGDLTVTGLVNGRDVATDGAKLDSMSTASQIVIATGQVKDGEDVPLPLGLTGSEDRYVLISPSGFSPREIGIGLTGGQVKFRVACTIVDPLFFTALVKWYQYEGGGGTPLPLRSYSGIADYIFIAIKK